MIQPFFGFLFARTSLTVVFTLATQHFHVGELLQTVADGRVLLHVDRQVEKVLLFGAGRFTVEALGLVDQNALEELVYPRQLFLFFCIFEVSTGRLVLASRACLVATQAFAASVGAAILAGVQTVAVVVRVG